MTIFMKKSLKYLLIVCCLGFVWLLIGYLSAKYAIRAKPAQITMPNQLKTYPYENVSFTTTDGLEIKAWLLGKSDTAVILLSGVKANRLANNDRALLYLEKGYSVLMPDLRGTGESGGEVVSFGWHEQYDLIAAYQYLEQVGKQKIGLHGSSLGAATITFALQSLSSPYFVVLESPYDHLEHAIQHRMEPFFIPQWLYSPMLFMGEWLADIKIDNLQPRMAIQDCNAPLLHLAGDQELVLTTNETQTIFDNCPSQNKQLYFFKGGKHQDFLKSFKIEYIQVLESFIHQLP